MRKIRKDKILNILLLLTSSFGYLEWSNQKRFLLSLEKELIIKATTDLQSVLHPFTIIPFLGQILLFVTLFQTRVNKWLTISGLAFLSAIMIMFLLIGILSLHTKMIVYNMPFIICSLLVIKYHFKKINS